MAPSENHMGKCSDVRRKLFPQLSNHAAREAIAAATTLAVIRLAPSSLARQRVRTSHHEYFIGIDAGFCARQLGMRSGKGAQEDGLPVCRSRYDHFCIALLHMHKRLILMEQYIRSRRGGGDVQRRGRRSPASSLDDKQDPHPA
jgi:hypothetical protein